MIRYPQQYGSDPGAFSDHHKRKYFYYMGDGSTKIWAAFIVMEMWFEREDENKITEATWTHDVSTAHAAEVFQSLLQIHCTRAALGDAVDDLIGLAVRQQTAALAQPLSTFQWAVCMRQRNVKSVGDFVARYNGHASVIAGGEELLFSRKKQWASSDNI